MSSSFIGISLLCLFSFLRHQEHPDQRPGVGKAHKAQDRGRVHVPPLDEKTERQQKDHEKGPRHERGPETGGISPPGGRGPGSGGAEKAQARGEIGNPLLPQARRVCKRAPHAQEHKGRDRPRRRGTEQEAPVRQLFDFAVKHRNTPEQIRSLPSYLPGGVFMLRTAYFFLPLVLAARASASAASILAVVETPHFLIWMRTRSSPVSKVTVSSVTWTILPVMAPMVVISSPTLRALRISSTVFFFLFSGRMKKK